MGRETLAESSDQALISALIYTRCLLAEAHALQTATPVLSMYTITPYFPTRGICIIANCFSITTNTQSAANKAIYEGTYAQFITQSVPTECRH